MGEVAIADAKTILIPPRCATVAGGQRFAKRDLLEEKNLASLFSHWGKGWLAGNWLIPIASASPQQIN